MREILEETSIIIKVGDQIENVNVIRKDANDKIKIHYVLSFYECTYISGRPQFGDDVVAAEWHQINKINEIKLIDGASEDPEDLRVLIRIICNNSSSIFTINN